jgi:hypothetical protein
VGSEGNGTEGIKSFGIIQRISDKRLDEIIQKKGVEQRNYCIGHVSLLRTLYKTGLMKTVEEVEDGGYLFEESKTEEDDNGVSPFKFILDSIMIGGEGIVMVLILLAIFGIVLAIFLLWVFVTIPLLLFLLSIITLEDAWKIFRVHTVYFSEVDRSTLDRIIHEVIVCGGIPSRILLDKVSDPTVRLKGYSLRENHSRFVKCVCFTSYLLFILGSLMFVDHFFNWFSPDIELLIYVIFGIPAIIGFAISLHLLYQRRDIKQAILKETLGARSG